jgi:hypothetical protein
MRSVRWRFGPAFGEEVNLMGLENGFGEKEVAVV